MTHAGPKETGTIRSVVPLGHLLASGIGDTVRISYANDPVYEVQDGLELMYILGLRTRKGAELIACPSCGRIQVDLFKMVQDVRKQLEAEITLPIKVAVMGCVVNGPGEAEGADVAIFAGDRKGIIYVQGERVAQRARGPDPAPAAGGVPQVPGQGGPRARRGWARRRSTSCRRTRSARSAAGGRRSSGRRAPGVAGAELRRTS